MVLPPGGVIGLTSGMGLGDGFIPGGGEECFDCRGGRS